MLTGQLPFDLNAGADLFCHQLFSPAPPPSWLLENVDPRLEQLILRCLRKHPENRYASMQALLDDLIAIESHSLAVPIEVSMAPLQRQPDVYIPNNVEGRDAAGHLARYFGLQAPRLPASQLGHEPEDTLDDTDFESVRDPQCTKLSRW
jgi:serine/threonine-protein kinase